MNLANLKFPKDINQYSSIIFHFSSEVSIEKTKKRLFGDKKIPAGCPAGEGGMVEEIYIHYYRHLVPLKSYTFLKLFFKKL